MWRVHENGRHKFVQEALAGLTREIEDLAGENAIQLVGEVWELRFGNERGQYPERGNQCIGWVCTILAHPNRHLTVAEVRGDPEGELAADALLHGERKTDAEGVKRIKRRLAEIADIRDETGGSPRLDEEEAALLRQLEEAPTQIKTPLKRAHHNIATQIRAFLHKLANDMPNLAAHLKAALKLEAPHFGYYPTPGTPAWKT
jgi:hypothetical protein